MPRRARAHYQSRQETATVVLGPEGCRGPGCRTPPGSAAGCTSCATRWLIRQERPAPSSPPSPPRRHPARTERRMGSATRPLHDPCMGTSGSSRLRSEFSLLSRTTAVIGRGGVTDRSGRRGSWLVERKTCCAATLYSVGSPGTRTMMQASASTTKLPGRRTLSGKRSKDHVMYRVAATSGVSGRPAGQRLPPSLPSAGGRRHHLSHPDTLRDLAGADHPPQGDQQLSSQGDDHCHPRSAAAVGGPLAIPANQRTVLLKDQETPGELDHSAPHPRIPGPRETALAAPRTALVG